jgi:hypothetical protein
MLMLRTVNKKLEFVEYFSRCSHNFTPFFLELSAWNLNRLAKKREAELKKNVKQSSLKTPLKRNLIYDKAR